MQAFPHWPQSFTAPPLQTTAFPPLQTYLPVEHAPHEAPGVPPLMAPHPPHALVPGSLQVTVLPVAQAYVPQEPHAPPTVPPVMAPHPPHAFFPGSLHVTVVPLAQVYVPHAPHEAPSVPPVMAPHPLHAFNAGWQLVPSQQPPLQVSPPVHFVLHAPEPHASPAGQSPAAPQPHVPPSSHTCPVLCVEQSTQAPPLTPQRVPPAAPDWQRPEVTLQHPVLHASVTPLTTHVPLHECVATLHAWSSGQSVVAAQPHWPLMHWLFPEHGPQLAPFVPQAWLDVLVMQVPVASQQPVGQLVGVHFGWQVPEVHVSSAVQLAQEMPAVPHVASADVSHCPVAEQQPRGHEVGVQGTGPSLPPSPAPDSLPASPAPDSLSPPSGDPVSAVDASLAASAIPSVAASAAPTVTSAMASPASVVPSSGASAEASTVVSAPASTAPSWEPPSTVAPPSLDDVGESATTLASSRT